MWQFKVYKRLKGGCSVIVWLIRAKPMNSNPLRVWCRRQRLATIFLRICRIPLRFSAFWVHDMGSLSFLGKGKVFLLLSIWLSSCTVGSVQASVSLFRTGVGSSRFQFLVLWVLFCVLCIWWEATTALLPKQLRVLATFNNNICWSLQSKGTLFV